MTAQSKSTRGKSSWWSIIKTTMAAPLAILLISLTAPTFGDAPSLTDRVLSTDRNLNPAQAAVPNSLLIKSVDVMKYTKDVVTNQPSDMDIDNVVGVLAGLNITHIAISIPMDASEDYPSGRRPAPRTAAAFTQRWSDAIHAYGLNVLWRGTWCGIEGIYNFTRRVGPNRFPAGTAASAPTDGNTTWLGKTYQYIINNPTFFADGDIWAPLPERTEGIFNPSTSFLSHDPPGIQANYVNFFNDLKQVSDAAFAQLGIAVLTGMTANNASEVLSGWLYQSLFDTAGVVAVDHYARTPEQMDRDLRQMARERRYLVFLQEWADYWNRGLSQEERTRYLQSIYTELQQLVNDDVLMGFNYWGGWDNDAEGILTRDSNGFRLNYRGELLAQFFAAN